MKRSHGERPIKDVLNDLLKINRLEKGYRQAEVVAAWESVMGTTIAKKTRSIRLDGHRLIVRLDSGVVKDEFSHSKTRLMEVMNEALRHAEIREVDIY